MATHPRKSNLLSVQLLASLLAFAAPATLATSAHATSVFSFTQDQLTQMADAGGYAPATLSNVIPLFPFSPSAEVLFVGNMPDGAPQYREILIGHDENALSAYGIDFSAYSGYSLTFTNTDNTGWYVNLFIITDPDLAAVAPTYYEANRVYLPAGASTGILLDFATANVANLDHVTQIGFNIGYSGAPYPIYGGAEIFEGDNFHMLVSGLPNDVPEPTTLGILTLGSLALLCRRRK